LIVENGKNGTCVARGPLPACQNNSDRMTAIQITSNQACSVISNSGWVLQMDNSSGTCCLNSLSVLQSQVMLVRVASTGQRWVSSVDLNTCRATVEYGPGAFNDSVAEPYDWSGAMLVPIKLKSFYLDTATNELVRYTFANGGGNHDAGSDSRLADRILDFQIALGFDFNPADGVVTDTANDTDEYLYNWQGGLETFGVGTFRNAAWNNMRMVELGLIIGLPSSNPNASGPTSVLDGPVINQPTWVLERQTSRFMLRSTRTYN
jgi:hypothetical protein